MRSQKSRKNRQLQLKSLKSHQRLRSLNNKKLSQRSQPKCTTKNQLLFNKRSQLLLNLSQMRLLQKSNLILQVKILPANNLLQKLRMRRNR